MPLILRTLRLRLRSRPGSIWQAAGLVGALTVAATAFPWGPALAGGDLIVRYDQSQLLRLPKAVSEIIVGNPSIADVAVQGNNLLVITGKTFGVTNVIALDSDRNIIQDQRIIVERDDGRSVTLTKGSARQSYSCTPNCSPTLTMGDDTAYFDSVLKHAAAKTRFSSEGSDSGSRQENQ